MKGQLCRVFLVLSLAMLVVSLPAQAAQGGQAGSSSPASDVSSGLSAGTSSEYAGEAPGIDTGSSISLLSFARTGPEETVSGPAPDSPGTPGTGMQPGTAGPRDGSSPPAGLPGDTVGRSDPGNNEHTGADTGSPHGTGGENAAGIPGARGQSEEPGRLAGIMVSHGGAVVARSAYGSGTGTLPAPDASRGPSPQRQHHGPPAQPGSYPCGPAQATPLPPAPGQAREETPSRQKSRRIGILSWLLDPDLPGPAPSSFPLQSLFPFNMLLLGGFRRISKKNVLEHDARQVIYQAITATPGIDVKTLTGITGINENTLRYHVDRLAATGKISCFTRPGIVRYFQNQGAYSPFEHRVFHYLRTDTPRGILWLLYQHPGLTRQHLADALAISGPSVTRQMDNLTGDGLVENRFPGRSNHYYLTAEAALAIDTVMSRAPVMIHSGIEAGPLPATAG